MANLILQYIKRIIHYDQGGLSPKCNVSSMFKNESM